jgi:nitroreductase
MELKDAIKERKSIRGFLDKPVEKETIEEILKLAQRSASALNSQPWEFAVITGDILKKIGEENVKDFREQAAPDYTYEPLQGEYKRRSVDLAKQLFGLMEIAREDKEKRMWWTERGFKFFDAPVAILIYIDESMEERVYRFDIGAISQTIALAAQEYGLGTCIEAQAITYQGGIRKYLDIPENKVFAVGIAIGYPDPEFAANRVETEREPLEDVVKWYGF